MLNYDFVELNRTFYELSQSTSENDDFEFNEAFHITENLLWSNLLEEYRVIILSEAGAGKTQEIRNVAEKLNLEKKHAFFLRLEHIPDSFEDAFEVGTFEEFNEWLASGMEGWILLDSVDEARLKHPRDFNKAIKILSRYISKALDRSHIIITSRPPPAWRPKSDLEYCTKHLPYSPNVTAKEAKPEDRDNLKDNSKVNVKIVDSGSSIFKTVKLGDLKVEQIRVFAKARDLKDIQNFLDAIERADAWSFTVRPQDLEEIIEFWIETGRIGSHLDVIKNSIHRRLKERDPDRADIYPISQNKLHYGVQIIAAATTLTEKKTIKVLESDPYSKGISIRSLLPDWNERELSTLLSRPIFDEAIYGAVRFHHRSVREFLAAEWFANLFSKNTNRRNIELLFFKEQYGIEIVTLRLRPLLPWLAILDDKIRVHLCKIAPEIILEGGDPSKLPFDTRREMLVNLCARINSGETNRSIYDYSAIQRFSKSDLANDIKSLLVKYSGNNVIVAFLFRMIWMGKLKELQSETLTYALSSKTEEYVRGLAFDAMKVIGSDENQKKIREEFLKESKVINRRLLSLLIKDLQPTNETIDWVISCLKNSAPEHRKYHDSVVRELRKFIDNAEVCLLVPFAKELSLLLETSPLIKERHCEVSQKNQWLLPVASKAIEKLIVSKHEITLEPFVLELLCKIFHFGYRTYETRNDLKEDFPTHIYKWPELKWSLCWYEVEKSRLNLETGKEKRITEYREAIHYPSFTHFDGEDFESALYELSEQTTIDNKLVALSIAFNIYKTSNRPRKWRERLKKITHDDNELSNQLSFYLNPPPETEEIKKWKQEEKRWERRKQAEVKKRENYHTNWKKVFETKLTEIKLAQENKSGQITNELLYLFDQIRNEESLSGRWTEYNWQTLIPEYGEEVARYYRDSVVALWRNYTPQLVSEGESTNHTKYLTILGLVGLEIEANEISNWPEGLNDDEIELACKYASFELNGFPIWFSKLFETKPEIVSNFLKNEISFELSKEKVKTRTHYILGDVCWSAAWAWNHLSNFILESLYNKEPKNLSNLEGMLTILQGSNISNEKIQNLAKDKCFSVRKLDHKALWFSVWVGVNPREAIPVLTDKTSRISSIQKRKDFVMNFLTLLIGGRNNKNIQLRNAYKAPEYLKTIYLFAIKYIRYKEDIDRTECESYSLELRDDAQMARGQILELLSEIPGKETFLTLNEIAQAHPEESLRSRIIQLAKNHAEKEGDMKSWSATEVREFQEKIERTPNNHEELAELVHLRLLDLRDDLENGDSSIASILKTIEQETEVRKYIGHELSEKALGRFSLPQEEELADSKKPDLRFHGMSFDAPVPVELKLADNWNGPKLFERLKNQLCGDYLRDNRSKRGFFVLVYRGQKSKWELPNSSLRVDFSGLISALNNHWKVIYKDFPGIDHISVVGIDLTKRST